MVEPAEDIEFKLLLEGLYLRYGYDFRYYSQASMRRRLRGVMGRRRLASLSQLQHELLHDPKLFAAALPELTVTTSDMFRDPSFFAALRQKVLPELRTYPSFKVWHAGCSSGEEVYSLAILLKEEGLYDKAVIYATDVNQTALKQAESGIYPTDRVQDFTLSYQKSGGRESFSNYYLADERSVRFEPSLRENVVFADHNLVTDGVFSEVHLILCRNVLIYFQRELQDRVFSVFAQSLRYRGFLGLGSKETVRFSKHSDAFDDLDKDERIYQKNAKGEARGQL